MAKKYLSTMNDPVVKRWLANLRRGNPVTADVALRRLGKACELLVMTPQDLGESEESGTLSIDIDDDGTAARFTSP